MRKGRLPFRHAGTLRHFDPIPTGITGTDTLNGDL
ncbi:hypothetical protein KRIGEM_00719 [Komagataeibacter rhaeticus]|nr:hypothetical protein KRIGEM_00719 [Komagataeibacter rhaeticus]